MKEESTMTELILDCRELTKTYDEGPEPVEVLKNIDFQLSAGQKVAIVGASGSGKSTLLNVLGGLDKPTRGEVRVNGKPFSSLSDNERGLVRNQSLGFVYQFHHLLPEFSAEENVAMPLRIAGQSQAQITLRVSYLLERVGVAHRASHKPAMLSGGERQRVAIARALATQPQCVLLDEPTGNLDKTNAENIHALIDELAAEANTSFVIVTHDPHLADAMDVIYELEEGCLRKRHAQ